MTSPEKESPCGSELHDEHLCYMVSQGMHKQDPARYESLVNSPAYCCARCGRVANHSCSLCKPVEMQACD